MSTGEYEELDEEFLVDSVGLIRGILVIVTAVAVGSFVILRGVDDTSGATELAGPAPAVEGALDAGIGVTSTAPGSTVEATPTTTVPVLDEDATTTRAGIGDDGAGREGTPASSVGILIGPGDVSVLVLNAAGTKGVAGRGVQVLSEAGYDTLAPRNADRLGGPSRIFYADGFEVVADDVAEVFDRDATGLVAELDPASVPIDDLYGADVVVVIGGDGKLMS